MEEEVLLHPILVIMTVTIISPPPPPIFQLRLQAIKRCEEAIMNAIRYGDPNVIQTGCVTQWNLCLPLTQPNLRRQIRKPLTLIAEALEDIQRSVRMRSCRERKELRS